MDADRNVDAVLGVGVVPEFCYSTASAYNWGRLHVCLVISIIS